MPAVESLFLLPTVLALALRLVRPRTVGRTADALVAVAFGAAVVQLLLAGPRLLLAPVYGLVALLGVGALVRRVRRGPAGYRALPRGQARA